VDDNPGTVARLRERGLRGLAAVEADASAHLDGLPPGSLDAVTAFHVVEHLDLEALLAFLAAARRALRPGGLLVAETPNPTNLVMGACNFHLDPTHRVPVPPAHLEFLAGAAGFTGIEVWALQKGFFGSQDYAILAMAPQGERAIPYPRGMRSVLRSPFAAVIVGLLAVGIATIVLHSNTPNAPDADSAPAAPASTSAHRVPGELLDLRDWYLTLPTGRPEDPDTVHQPQLTTYIGTHFRLDEAGTGVVFSAPAGGATTKGSRYPRSELREMDGEQKAAWSNRTGRHILTVRQAVTALPPVKPEVVVAQIHDAQDDVMLVRCEGSRLVVQWDDGDSEVVLDPAYRLGTPYELRIVAAAGRVEVFLDGVRKAEVPLSGSGWYFKTGSYVQSNLDRGEASDAVGEVVIYGLALDHA